MCSVILLRLIKNSLTYKVLCPFHKIFFLFNYILIIILHFNMRYHIFPFLPRLSRFYPSSLPPHFEFLSQNKQTKTQSNKKTHQNQANQIKTNPQTQPNCNNKITHKKLWCPLHVGQLHLKINLS